MPRKLGTAPVRATMLDPASENRRKFLGQQSDAVKGTGVVDHVAFRCTGLPQMMEHLTRLKVPFKRRMVNDQGLFQLFLMDPNEVKVELNFANSEVNGVRADLMASDLPAGDKA